MSRATHDPEARRSIAFEDPVSLRSPHGGPSGLFLAIYLQFVTVSFRQRWQIAPRMYEYRLLDHDQTELLVYHWQPGASFQGPDYPHLHVSAALHAQVDARHDLTIDLDRLHVVTGYVTLDAVVRMLITEFQIAPLRSDWQQTLARAEAALREEITQDT